MYNSFECVRKAHHKVPIFHIKGAARREGCASRGPNPWRLWRAGLPEPVSGRARCPGPGRLGRPGAGPVASPRLRRPQEPHGIRRGGSVHRRAGTEQHRHRHHHHHQHITQEHGRQSPQAEHGGEGAAAAQPESRGVERGGRQRCHLQRVPLQGLQPGLWLHDQSGSTGRKTGSPSRVVQCVQQGSHHPEHPRLRGFVGAGHQPGQLHRAGGSFPLLTSQNPTVPLCPAPRAFSHFHARSWIQRA